MRFSIICIALLTAFAASATGAAAQSTLSPSASPPAAASTPATINDSTSITGSTSSAYVLGRDDVIDVGLLGRTDFGGRARVQADGSIQLPLIGKLPAAEHTTAELSDQVRKALQTGGYFADPIVSIEVVSYSARYVTVLGAVGAPGLIPINKPYRLSEILARVGGVRDTAADYLVLRPEKGAEKQYKIKDLATGDLTQDPYVQAGDKIYSPLAETFYIYGQVHSPGVYALVNEMTVRMAIAKSGGLTEQGNDKSVDVTRGGKKMKLDIAGKLQPGDVVVVKERLF